MALPITANPPSPRSQQPVAVRVSAPEAVAQPLQGDVYVRQAKAPTVPPKPVKSKLELALTVGGLVACCGLFLGILMMLGGL